MSSKSSVPLLGKLGSSSDCLVPHYGEVSLRGEVVGDCYGGVNIEHHVPHSSREKNGLTYNIK